MLEIKNVNKIYNRNRINSFTALKDISVDIKEKGFHVFYGQSGSGKTTLFNCISGLDSIDSGDIVYLGKKMEPKEMNEFREKNIGLIFQNYYLNNEETVFQNIFEVFTIRGVEDSKVVNEKIMKVLSILGIKHLKNRKVAALSGGQQQRVAIARALVKSPKVILADEPTGNLDSENTKMILEILKELSKEIAVVLISHEQDIVDQYADYITTMRSGSIIETIKNNKSNMQLRVEKNKFNISVLEHTTYRGATKQKIKNTIFNDFFTFKFSKRELFKNFTVFLLTLTLVVFSQTILGNLFPSDNTANYYPSNTLVVTSGTETDFLSLLDDLGEDFVLSSNMRDVEEYSDELPRYFLNTYISIIIPTTYTKVGSTKGQLFSSNLLTSESIVVGTKDIKIDEVVISKYLADDLLFSLNKYYQYGIENYEDLLGLPIEFDTYNLEKHIFNIKGVSLDNSYSLYIHHEGYIHSHLKQPHEGYALLSGIIDESYNLLDNELIVGLSSFKEVGETQTYNITRCYVEYLCDNNFIDGDVSFKVDIPEFSPGEMVIDNQTAEEYMITHIISKSILVDSSSKKVILLLSNSENIDDLLDDHYISAVNANDYLKDIRFQTAMASGKLIFLVIGYLFLILVLIQVFRSNIKLYYKQTAIKKLLGQQNKYILLSILTNKFLKNLLITIFGVFIGLHYIDLYQKDISDSLLDMTNIINSVTYMSYIMLFLTVNVLGIIPSILILRRKPIQLIKDISL